MTRTITLGGRDFAIGALTLDQLQCALPAFASLRTPASQEGMAAIRTIVAAGLGLSDPEAGALTATLPELLDAVSAIAELSGLRALGEAAAVGAA